MDQGVISSLKRQYKKSFLREILFRDERLYPTIADFLGSWDVLETLKLVEKCWKSLKEETYRNPWNNLLPRSVQNITRANNQEVGDAIAEQDAALAAIDYLKKITDTESFSSQNVIEWLRNDNNLRVFETLSDEQIFNLYVHGSTEIENGTVPAEDQSDPGNESDDAMFDEEESLSSEDILKYSKALCSWANNQSNFNPEWYNALVGIREQAYEKTVANDA